MLAKLFAFNFHGKMAVKNSQKILDTLHSAPICFFSLLQLWGLRGGGTKECQKCSHRVTSFAFKACTLGIT